jgi:hypothetical protein
MLFDIYQLFIVVIEKQFAAHTPFRGRPATVRAVQCAQIVKLNHKDVVV